VLDLPEVAKLADDFSDREFAVVGVLHRDRPRWALDWLVEQPTRSFPTVVDEDGRIAQLYGVNGIPRYFLIDPSGRVAANAFGFGGVNAHVVLEDYPPAEAGRDSLLRDLDSELIIIESDTRVGLRHQAEQIRNYAESATRIALRDVAHTLAASRAGKGHVLGIVATSLADLAAKLSRAATMLADEKTAQIKDPKGIYYFSESAKKGGKVAFLFPGEGAQYLNMLADLCVHFPAVRAFFDSADRAVSGTGRYPLSYDVFPPPLLSEQEAKAAEHRLWQIERATEAVLFDKGFAQIGRASCRERV